MPVINLIFYFFALMLIASALYAVTTRNIIRAVFALFLSFFSVSGIFVFAHADFLAITQIVVYVGGVLVIILFGIMLSNKNVLDLIKNDAEEKPTLHAGKVVAIGISFCLLLIFFAGIKSDVFSTLAWTQGEIVSQSNVRQTGINLMTTYLLPFEIISLVLLMVLIAAAFVARKDPEKK